MSRKQLKRLERDGKFYTVRGVELTRASGTMTEAQFWAFILSSLRRATKYWKPKMDKLREGRRASQSDNKRLKWEFDCESCKQWFAQKDIEIDHITACGGLNGADKLVIWVQRAFVEIDGYQRLCKSCHKTKSYGERYDKK